MRRHLTIALSAALAAVLLAPAALTAQRYRGIYVAAPGDIWLVGDGGIMVHGRAGSWVRTPDGSPLPDMNAVTGFGPNNVWAVGDEGTILHWDGTGLSRPNSGTAANLVAVFGCAPNDVWAVGASADDREPAVVLHYDGSSWSVQRLSLSFRASGIAGSCPDLVIAGIAYWDPRPDQRRDVGVVARLRGGQWTTAGYDGHRVTDEQLGGTGWTSVTGTGGMAIIAGRGKVLISRGGGTWTPLNGVPDALALVVTMDGSVAAVHAAGFSRQASGAWRTVGQGAMETAAGSAYQNSAQQAAAPRAGTDTAAVHRIQARLEAISRAVPPNGTPTAAQMSEMMQLSQQLMVANGGAGQMNIEQVQQIQAQAQAAQAESQRNQTTAQRNAGLHFGDHPAAFGATGSDFYVVGEGVAMHVSGDVSRVVFTSACLYSQNASSTAECRADGGTGSPPVALTVPPPVPHLDGPAVTAPTTTNPLPSIRKPRIRIP